MRHEKKESKLSQLQRHRDSGAGTSKTVDAHARHFRHFRQLFEDVCAFRILGVLHSANFRRENRNFEKCQQQSPPRVLLDNWSKVEMGLEVSGKIGFSGDCFGLT